MTRIKVLGLALVAVFAMGALASSAMAVPTLETNLANVNLNGEQVEKTNDVFTVDGSNVTCENATYNAVGVTANGAPSAILHPEYSSCTAFGFIGATVATKGCNYEGKAEGEYEEVPMTFKSGSIKISCEEDKENKKPFEIKINAGSGTCVATVAAQTIGGGTQIRFSNTTNALMDFDIHATNANVATTKNADNFGCPFNGTGPTTGTYNGTTTVRCFNPTNGTQVGCTIKP